MRKANAMWWMARWPGRMAIAKIRDMSFESDVRFTDHVRSPLPNFLSGLRYTEPP